MSRPYFEMKVVRAKEEKCKHQNVKCKCDKCGEILVYGKMRHPKGNWVNGENLDKIKFPCFCSFIEGGERYHGEINTNYNEHKEKLEYELSNISDQVSGKEIGKSFSVRYSNFSLKDLIKNNDIHIRKGKIIIYEEK